MQQMPQEIWNEIAVAGPLKHKAFSLLFRMNQDQVTVALERQAILLQKNGVENKVIIAYQHIAPVWAERQAITSYLIKTGRFDLRQILPGLESITEGMDLVTLEYGLSKIQRNKLEKLLRHL